MTIPEIITMGKDILLGVAAVTASVVAIKGLSSWNRELKGKTEFEAARNLAKAVYRVRDEMQRARAPLVRPWEFPSGYPGEQDATAEQKAQALAHVYNNRMEPVREAVRKLDPHALEAETLWGNEVRTKIYALRQCAGELQTAMEAIVDDALARGEHFEHDREFGRRIRSIAHASPQDDSNELTRNIKEAIEAIEDIVRPHLRRK